MSRLVPTFQGETQFAGYADSSKGGPRITLRLADREALEAFIGAEGQRFACVLVRIGEDEQPVPPPAPTPAKPPKPAPADKPDHALSKWAALRCADTEFWKFIEQQCEDDHIGLMTVRNKEDAAQWIRDVCEVKSRAEFDVDPAAAERFKARVMRPWQRHCIATGVTQ